MGWFGAIAGQYSYNTPGDGTTYACGLNGHNCIQKSGNTWINSYTNNVEVQLATYDISKLNDLQNLNRTVANLTVDTLHGLGPNCMQIHWQAGSATGTQTTCRDFGKSWMWHVPIQQKQRRQRVWAHALILARRHRECV